jgi:hypothetical protein
MRPPFPDREVGRERAGWIAGHGKEGPSIEGPAFSPGAARCKRALRPPVKTAHGRGGKAARAEPIAAVFETGEAKLAGRFPELEDQLAGLIIGGEYQGPGRSPDRADAMMSRSPCPPDMAANVWGTFAPAHGRSPNCC